MRFRDCIVSYKLALLLLIGVVEASAQKAPSAKTAQRFYLTIRVALLLVTVPRLFVTLTSKTEPLSSGVVGGVT